MTAPLRLVTPDLPDEADRAAILAPLRAYNVATAGDPHIRPVAVLLHDDGGATVGGLWGRIGYDWLFVEYLVVPEAARGQRLGTALMAEAERIARDAGCCGLWLDTYDFQARPFYEGLGFTVFGTLEDHPIGSRRHFLSKRLEPDTSAG